MSHGNSGSGTLTVGLRDWYRGSHRERETAEQKAAAAALYKAVAVTKEKAKEEEKSRVKEKEEGKAVATGIMMTGGDDSKGSIATASRKTVTALEGEVTGGCKGTWNKGKEGDRILPPLAGLARRRKFSKITRNACLGLDCCPAEEEE